jgi:two-component system phosphate regulon response regulator PhoB
MLTARGDEYDRVIGFELGADDYVPKPFNVTEVVLRVRALARRYRERRIARLSNAEVRRIRWRDLEIDPAQQRAYLAGQEVTLQPIPFKLLALFLSDPGRVFSREEILDQVWGEGAGVGDRAVDQHVRRLRKDLGPYAEAIETVYGFGYRIREP